VNTDRVAPIGLAAIMFYRASARVGCGNTVSIIFRLGACSACSLRVRTLARSFIAPVNELIVQVVGIVFAREVPVAFHRPFHSRLDLGDLPEGFLARWGSALRLCSRRRGNAGECGAFAVAPAAAEVPLAVWARVTASNLSVKLAPGAVLAGLVGAFGSDRKYAMIDLFGTPYTDKLNIVERYRLRDYDVVRDALERNSKENLPT
jgi:hypothetical protein